MTPVDPLSVPERIDLLLAYIETMRAQGDGPYGRYVYRAGETVPLVYCSTYAAMARDLVSDLDSLASSERQEWIGYLNAHQCDDGLYRDPAFGLPDDLIDVPLRADAGWAGGIAGWGWWHMTNDVYTALRSLDAVAPKTLALLAPFYSETTSLETWLDERNWDLSWSVGNEVLNLGTFLLYARDFHNEPRAGKLVARMLNWLDANQDPETGYWGTDCTSPVGKRQAMCGAYHEYILYACERRPIPRIEQIVDATLSLQNPGGGFGCDGKSGACEDIDAAFIFLSAYYQQDYRRDDIEDAVAKVHALDRASYGVTPDDCTLVAAYLELLESYEEYVAHTATLRRGTIRFNKTGNSFTPDGGGAITIPGLESLTWNAQAIMQLGADTGSVFMDELNIMGFNITGSLRFGDKSLTSSLTLADYLGTLARGTLVVRMHLSGKTTVATPPTDKVFTLQRIKFADSSQQLQSRQRSPGEIAFSAIMFASDGTPMTLAQMLTVADAA